MPLLIAAFIIIGVWLLVPGEPASVSSSGDDLTMAGSSPEYLPEITSDFSTWPAGDKIWEICHAIALAEGANLAGSVPDRLNNPGDLSDGFATFGGEAHSGSNVTRFPSKAIGWQWLYNKINNIATGKSSSYSVDWTWNQIAQTWAGDWQHWVNNVTTFLQVSPQSTMRQYLS